MCLRAKLTGDGIDEQEIIKYVNVQQNPGRGAKAVVPKIRSTPYHQQKHYNRDGSSRDVIKVAIKFALGVLGLP